MSLPPLTPEEVRHARAVLDHAAETVGYAAWMTNAEWGRVFGDLVYATRDERAIRYLLAEGGESFRLRHQSDQRRLSRTASKTLTRLARVDQFDAAAVDGAIARQLGFEVNAPGWAPVPLRLATHELLTAADENMGRQIKGMEQNRAIIRRARRLTTPYPGRTIESLIADSLISLGDLFRDDDRAVG